MKIFIDIGHPAHVHYFKNFTKEFIRYGHQVFFSVRDKETSLDLIKELGFDYSERGKGGENIFTKIIKLPLINYKLLKYALKVGPDLFLSFASPYAAHVSTILKKPHISFDDTEHAVWAHKLYRPFTDVILSPSCYVGGLHKNQLLFESYMELCYLHPKYFTPDKSVLNDIGVDAEEKFVIVRFVSWNANHDVGQQGFTNIDKIKLIVELSKHCKVFISSEDMLPEELKKYNLKINPSRLHDVLSFATLYIGEGSTTATESSVLGIPAIFVNSLKLGYCMELEEKFGLMYNINETSKVLEKAIEILQTPYTREKYHDRRKKMLSEKINPTEFMIWFIENWPDSRQIHRYSKN